MNRDPDKTRAWHRRSTPINPVSKKRRATFARRKAVLAIVFERDGGCVMRPGGPCHVAGAPPCQGFWDGHEPLRRSQGGDPLDPDQVVTLCRGHHDWAHSHIAQAKALGLLIVPGQRDAVPSLPIPSAGDEFEGVA